MIKVNCDCCGNELIEPGALFFSPPTTMLGVTSMTKKYHICTECWFRRIEPDILKVPQIPF